MLSGNYVLPFQNHVVTVTHTSLQIMDVALDTVVVRMEIVVSDALMFATVEKKMDVWNVVRVITVDLL